MEESILKQTKANMGEGQKDKLLWCDEKVTKTDLVLHKAILFGLSGTLTVLSVRWENERKLYKRKIVLPSAQCCIFLDMWGRF